MTESQGDAYLTVARLEQLASAGLRIAVAESLTGGLLADAFVSVPGASGVFSGGIVCYNTALKHTLLGVDAELLRERGPVDARVAEQMARGVREACAVPPPTQSGVPTPGGADESLRAADIGLATTGVAGPDPDAQSGQPAGTVWLGISSRLGERSLCLRLSGDRARIRVEAVRAAVDQLAIELDALQPG